ncbi:MAG: nucleotide exchange factor GrpE [Candidatus Yonathbacteria bacterium RIFCSPHIGHO2_01_FULL_51_10]|uniref:Protein GrpE n=1 Tax=Candidatus Yonathbacteria bacterium RIFCSPHIGHO2_01_FULL_51_10 TaxID=1802723 RepID=A0A1G2S6D3_9BACT|nr:MAG: nucleotide exchange factor GrpE [Candidatus Yonathbacteria bacterium RIFCSPHIGHO2_01_FULL_51_10]
MSNQHSPSPFLDPDISGDEIENPSENDITIEEDTENTAADAAAALRKVKEKLATCIKEKDEYLQGWQRARADFANAKREEDSRRTETVKFAKESVFLDILPVLDSFAGAFGNKEAWEKVDANWRKGVEYIHSQLINALEQNGITEIDPLGKPFDHREQVSTEMVPTDDPKAQDTVVEVIQKGYKLHDKVIRPARVKVAVHEGKTQKEA